MKKRTVLSVFMLVIALQTEAITNYQIGDQLNVLAKSGLSLRSKPSPDAEKISVVGYGESITVSQQDFKTRKTHSVVDNKLPLLGYWVKVNHKGKEGYIFDGYLTKLAAPSLTNNSNPKEGEDYMEIYCNKNSPRAERIAFIESSQFTPKYHQKYKDGSLFELETYEGGETHRIQFKKGTSLEEGYLIALRLWFTDKEEPSGVEVYNERKEISLSGEASSVTIKKNSQGLIIAQFFAGD